MRPSISDMSYGDDARQEADTLLSANLDLRSILRCFGSKPQIILPTLRYFVPS